MERTGLSQWAEVFRLRYAVVLVVLLVLAYWLGIQPWMTNWGATAAEQQTALPGDDLRPAGSGQSTMAITIDAPPEAIWPWLVQIGQDRAGFYTYTWLENLIGADIHNSDQIHPEWQQLAVGDAWRLVPPDYLGGVGKDARSPILMIEPGRALVVEMFGANVIVPVDADTSRLIVRGASGPPSVVQTFLIDPIVFTMSRRMFLGIKARAEGRPDSPQPLLAVAQLGWLAAGLAVASLFLRERRRRYWLVLPLLATLPALFMGHDPLAGLAAFIATGIVVLGFLILGRHWWGPLLVIASVVMLALLLAPDAFVAIGLAFAALLLATAIALLAGRRKVAAVDGQPAV